ncbi:unnamed protein product [Caenorhabditis bovis]|uniref:UDP-N-acetylglucosamine transferase subunit ALG13 n=1 Tax=Caenorhabditis bovis TaxID=2654633 RepID=A0A8S1E5H7_9PELO|nr:unnamed protein product [Caenorhabditis bovis]
MTCFVTVGTTLFEDLINEVLSDQCLTELRKLGIHKLKIQIGHGNFNDAVKQKFFNNTQLDEGNSKHDDIEIEYFRFLPNLNDNMKEAMIIIGHAGAGTCLEVLRLNKPFIVVINEKLMDNHQAELAMKLSEGLHLLHCTPTSLSSTISNPCLFALIPFEPISQKRVATFIDQRMGIVRN